jgi:hypothetical protein
MFKERRAVPRSNFNRYARMQAETAGPSRDCLIVNISDEGVRLHMEVAEIPDDFTLVIAGAEQERRSCHVMWRLGYEIGARFTDRGRRAMPRSARSAA